MDFHFKKNYNVYDLEEVIKALRSEDGCPWDKVQTHTSIRRDFIEEVYEAVEAIDEKSPEHLREELGDVLFQVIFHCVIESEQDHYTLDDVADEVAKKMIARHPHVFGEVTLDSDERLFKNWEQIKMQTHGEKTPLEAMESVPKSLPSLMRAEKLVKKSKRLELSQRNDDEILSEIKESAAALERTVKSGDNDALIQEIGRLLFSVCELSGSRGLDAEKSLYDACDEFIGQFRK